MIDITQLQHSTIRKFKNICTDQRETLEYMKNSGTSFEKAVALVILAAGGEENA